MNWSERLRLVGLASVSLLVSNLNILALKVVMVIKMVQDTMRTMLIIFREGLLLVFYNMGVGGHLGPNFSIAGGLPHIPSFRKLVITGGGGK